LNSVERGINIEHHQPKPQKKEFPILEVSMELAISCTYLKPVLVQIIEIRIPSPMGKKKILVYYTVHIN
jgi:hypothetical protein